MPRGGRLHRLRHLVDDLLSSTNLVAAGEVEQQVDARAYQRWREAERASAAPRFLRNGLVGGEVE